MVNNRNNVYKHKCICLDIILNHHFVVGRREGVAKVKRDQYLEASNLHWHFQLK